MDNRLFPSLIRVSRHGTRRRSPAHIMMARGSWRPKRYSAERRIVPINGSLIDNRPSPQTIVASCDQNVMLAASDWDHYMIYISGDQPTHLDPPILENPSSCNTDSEHSPIVKGRSGTLILVGAGRPKTKTRKRTPACYRGVHDAEDDRGRYIYVRGG